MSTSLVPTLDRENAGAHLGGTHEKHHLLGSQKKLGEHPSRAMPVHKQFLGISSNFQKSHRSFGEISNRLDRGSDNSSSGPSKMLNQPSLSTACKPEMMQKEVTEVPEFIPSIPEDKDYSDIIPSSLSLSRKQLDKFAHFWESCQKPDLHIFDASRLSSSPPQNLTFLPIARYEEKLMFDPVPEDVFDLPPPWE